MTMVEAAAFGAPSLVHVGQGGAVGATELLRPEEGLVFNFDLSSDEMDIASHVEELLQRPERLAEVALAARECSLSWSEVANAQKLVSMLQR